MCFSPWAEGVVPKCLDISRHPCGVQGSPEEAGKLGCLTRGCSQCWDRMRRVPAAPAQLNTQMGALRGTAGPLSPRGAAAWGVHPFPCAQGEGGVVSRRWDGGIAGGGESSHPLPAPTVPRSTCRGPQAPFPSPPLPFMQLAQGSRAWGSFQASPAGVWQL